MEKHNQSECKKYEKDGRTYCDETCTLLHSFGDLPAVVDKQGNKYWYAYGKRHRFIDYEEDSDSYGFVGNPEKPAILYADRRMEWWDNGKFIHESRWAHTPEELDAYLERHIDFEKMLEHDAKIAKIVEEYWSGNKSLQEILSLDWKNI